MQRKFAATMDADFYNTIEKSSVAEFKDKGSKFIAYVFPITDVNQFKESLAATSATSVPY